MNQSQSQKQENTTAATKVNLSLSLKVRLQPEWYKVANALSTILGFETFEDYVSDCIELNVRMYIEEGENIDEQFRAAYRHLVYESENESENENVELQTGAGAVNTQEREGVKEERQ